LQRVVAADAEQAQQCEPPPVRPQATARPNHLHTADGKLLADPLTRTDASAWDNLQRVITTILDNPLLEKPAIGA
jgi:hypothetical protein